jgi:cell wall-associated NlpC family hydrolase
MAFMENSMLALQGQSRSVLPEIMQWRAAMDAATTSVRTQTSDGMTIDLDNPGDAADPNVRDIIKLARQQLGDEYDWGSAAGRSDWGKNPNIFDCSGFYAWLKYRAEGKKLQAYTGALVKSGKNISLKNIQPGDAVFFRSDYGHMGMYIGNGKFIHASSTDGVKISSFENYAYPSAIRRH